MNFVKYLFLLGSIICGAIGLIAMLMAGESDSQLWSWVAWLIYIPAFSLLYYMIEDYGIGSAITLWAGGTAVLVALFVMVLGASWGEMLNSWQYGALGVTVVGLFGLSLTSPAG